MNELKILIEFISRAPKAITDRPFSNMSYEFNSPYYMPGLDKLVFSSYNIKGIKCQ